MEIYMVLPLMIAQLLQLQMMIQLVLAFEYSSKTVANERESPPANSFTSNKGFLNILQNYNATMRMGKRNKTSDDDEDGTIPIKHGCSDVLPKLIDNINKHMERRLSVAQKHGILLQDANNGRLFCRELTGEPRKREPWEHNRREVR